MGFGTRLEGEVPRNLGFRVRALEFRLVESLGGGAFGLCASCELLSNIHQSRHIVSMVTRIYSKSIHIM